jgi:ABC-2 type transport system permease protein
MKLLSVFVKSTREQIRDPLGLSLSLAFAPFMILAYLLMIPSGSTVYDVLVLDQDRGAKQANGGGLDGSAELVQVVQSITYENGDPLLRVKYVDDREQADRLLKERDADVLLILPPDFSETLLATQAFLNQGEEMPSATVTFVGDLTNPYYAVAGVMVNAALEGFIQSASGLPRPVNIVEEALGASGARSEFEIYVPGLLIFATILLLFQAAMTITREAEAGTLRRLQITRMTSFDFLAGTSSSLALTGIAAMLLAFFTAQAAGFHSQGPLWIAILIAGLTSFSVIGTGLIVAAFSRTTSQAFLIANFPLGLFMFFSSIIYPIPRFPLFSIGGHNVSPFDILPPTHAVAALNKVLTMGTGLDGIVYELAGLVILAIFYFAAGVWLFQYKHLRPGT